MTIILNGTTGITTPGITNQGVVEFTAGSVSAPSLTTTGDTNTGIYFPAADTIAFTEGGVESMRIDSSGNVGIGTASPSYKLDVRGSANIVSWSDGTTPGVLYSTGGYVGLTFPAQSGGFFINPAGNFCTISTNGVERLRLDASGNLGIGTTSPGSILEIKTTTPLITLSASAYTSQYQTTLGAKSGADAYLIFGNNGLNEIRAGRTNTGGYLDFYTNNTVAQASASDGNFVMRLTAAGELLVGTTSNTSSSKFAVNGRVGFYDANGNQNAVSFVPNKGLGATNSAGFGLGFVTVNYTPASASSNIYWDGNTGFFTLSTSARKYKRNIVRVSNEQLDKALLLKPSYYQRLEYDYWEYGFIAEEVNEIGFDEFVTRAEGEISGLNYEKMVTLAFGLIQRQEKVIKQLEAKVTALESK